jgi:phage terminase small subunit
MVNAGMSGADACQKIRPKLTRGSAKTKAYELRKLPHIQAYLAELDARAVEEAAVTRTFVLQQLKSVAGFDPRKLYDEAGNLKPVNELDDETAAGLAGIEVDERLVGEDRSVLTTKKLRHWSKPEALKTLAQILSMTKDQLEISTVVRVIDMTGKKDETPSNG